MRREDYDKLVDVYCPKCNNPRQVKMPALKGMVLDGPPPYPKVCRSCKYSERTLSDETKSKIRDALSGVPKPESVKSKIRKTRQQDTPVVSARLAEFLSQHSNVSSHDKVTLQCDTCPRMMTVTKTSAIEKIKATGKFRCRSCGVTQGYQEHPWSDEARAKVSQRLKGVKRSQTTKDKMSSSKKALYQTEHGQKLRRALSEKAAREHSTHLHDTSRRRGVYPSTKMGRPIAFGSSYELKAIIHAETNENVVNYETQVYFEVEGRHRCLDLLLTYPTGYKLAVEIKPKRRLTESAIELQIADSRQYWEAQGVQFAVWTEQDLGFQSETEATAWADEFLSTLSKEDFVEARKQMGREKANRSYNKNKEENKVEATCSCGNVYSISKNMYNQNIKRNGCYVCKPCSDKRPKKRK